MKLSRASGTALLGILIILQSCAPKRAEIVLDTDRTKAGSLVHLVKMQQNKLESIVGRGMLSFDSPEIAGTAAFESSMKKPDSLLVTVEGPFGISVGTFFLSREKYILYSSFENRVITGVPSVGTIRSVIPFDLTYDDILNAFSGLFALPGEENLTAYSVDDGLFLLSYRCGSNTCKYWVDPAYLLVTKYELYNSSGSLITDASASSFAEEGDVWAPRRIVVTFPAENRQLTIHYRSMELNAPNPSFAFTIPSNAQTIIR